MRLTTRSLHGRPFARRETSRAVAVEWMSTLRSVALTPGLDVSTGASLRKRVLGDFLGPDLSS
mgnify:CR=1 FL=1